MKIFSGYTFVIKRLSLYIVSRKGYSFGWPTKHTLIGTKLSYIGKRFHLKPNQYHREGFINSLLSSLLLTIMSWTVRKNILMMYPS